MMKQRFLFNGRNARTNFPVTHNSNEEHIASTSSKEDQISLSEGISEMVHAKLKRSSTKPSPSLTCSRLDSVNSHIGVWKKQAGACLDSNWVMRVAIGNKSSVVEEHVLTDSCSSSSSSSMSSATNTGSNKFDEEERLAMQMIEKLLNTNID